ncbi:hypothetical protein ACFQX7_38245 [Luedemannella flava]
MKNLFIGFVIAIVLAAFFNASERAENRDPSRRSARELSADPALERVLASAP